MTRLGWRPSPGTTIGLLALVVAVAGTAMAGPLATESVLRKGEKKQVRKIARSQVKSHAPRLAVARAESASNANMLDGLDSGDFTPAETVQSDRFAVNDPAPGDSDAPFVELLEAAVFTVSAACAEELDPFPPGTDRVEVQLTGPAGSSFSGARSNGGSVDIPTGSQALLASTIEEVNVIASGQLTALAPTGEVVHVSASAEVHEGAGCIVAVTAIGP
jgi:hypothetical protein